MAFVFPPSFASDTGETRAFLEGRHLNDPCLSATPFRSGSSHLAVPSPPPKAARGGGGARSKPGELPYKVPDSLLRSPRRDTAARPHRQPGGPSPGVPGTLGPARRVFEIAAVAATPLGPVGAHARSQGVPAAPGRCPFPTPVRRPAAPISGPAPSRPGRRTPTWPPWGRRARARAVS